MLVTDEKDTERRYIIVASEGIKIQDYYTKECDFILPMVRKDGGVVISITISKLIDNYERLIQAIPSGSGYYLRKAAYAMIAVDEIDIWAGILDSDLLRDIMRRNAPHSLLDMVENLQDYYMDYYSPQFLYIQLATIMLDIMCIHLANPDEFFDVLVTKRERAILDYFDDVDIMDMFWDPLMREKANRAYYRKLSFKKKRLMACTAEKYRDELLMCMAYINQE